MEQSYIKYLSVNLQKVVVIMVQAMILVYSVYFYEYLSVHCYLYMCAFVSFYVYMCCIYVRPLVVAKKLKCSTPTWQLRNAKILGNLNC